MFDLSPAHLMVLAVVGILVLGPEKLPRLARDAARMVRTVRDLVAAATAEVRAELAPVLADLDSTTDPSTPTKTNH